jgi:hypothetical protein
MIKKDVLSLENTNGMKYNMSENKCPICGTEMKNINEYDYGSAHLTEYECPNPDCRYNSIRG